MINSKTLHLFVSGLFVATLLTPHIWITAILSVVLILIWGNFILPILSALILDASFVNNREFFNIYGFVLTSVTMIATVILLKLRKFLKF